MGQGTPGSSPNKAPSLAAAINETDRVYPVPVDVNDPAIVKESLKSILSVIKSQLYSSLFEAWFSTEGRGDLPIESLGSLNEKWARLITEMLLFTPYGGPDSATGVYPESRFWQKMAGGSLYPVTAACQHLCTMAAITRGFPVENKPYNAGDGGSIATLNGIQGKTWSKGRINGDPQDVKVAYRLGKSGEPVLGPGSVYVKTAGTSPHIAFILRTNGDQARIQFFDTGGMRPQEPEGQKPKALIETQGGEMQYSNYDYNWDGRVNQPCSEWGFLPEQGQDNLQQAIEKMRRARPLGLARLVLRKKIDDKTAGLLFATPLLLMFDKSKDTLNFSIARYLWSLRYMPKRKDLEGLFLIYIPQSRMAEVMLEASRDTSLDQMIKTVSDEKKTPNFLCVSVLSTSPDIVPSGGAWQKASSFDQGHVIVKHRRHSRSATFYFYPPPSESIKKFITLPWDKPSYGSTDLRGFDWENFEYFKGEWSENVDDTGPDSEKGWNGKGVEWVGPQKYNVALPTRLGKEGEKE